MLFIFTQLLKKYSMPEVEAWCMSAVQRHDAGHVLYIDFIDFLLIHQPRQCQLLTGLTHHF